MSGCTDGLMVAATFHGRLTRTNLVHKARVDVLAESRGLYLKTFADQVDSRSRRKATVAQEREGQMRGPADSVDPTGDRLGDLVEALAGQVGQLHPLEAGPQRLSRFATVRGSLAKRV